MKEIINNQISENIPAYPNENAQELLVNEIWAPRQISNRIRVEKIAKHSGLPLVWTDKAPGLNGEKGIEKLNAERGVLLLRDRASSFIEQFEHPIGRCAKFYKLTAYNNCNFWCEYCYLYLTFRTQPISTHFINYEKLYDEIKKFDNARIPRSLKILNLGELGDPLAVDYITGFAKQIITFMPKYAPATRLLFLTKSDCIDDILNIDHGGQSVISFSVNTDAVYTQLEHRTPPPESRLAAAKKVQKAGYEVRLRIDPIIYYSTWEKDYTELVNKIFHFVKPARITLGEYRPANGLANHIRSRFPDSPLLKVHSTLIKEGGKLRYPIEQRIRMFNAIVQQIRKNDTVVKVSLCKELPHVWRAVGLEMKGLSCNCVE
jgi:spore photoproduct lyase